MAKDIRVQNGFWSHHKTLLLLRRLGSDAVLSLLQLWSWASEFRPDGSLDGMDPEAIEIVCGWPKEREPYQLFDALVALGWIDLIDSDGHGGRCAVLHDWATWQPWVVDEPRRVASAKTAAKARWDGVRALPREAPRSLSQSQSDATRIAPSPSPSPSASETDAKEREPSAPSGESPPATEATPVARSANEELIERVVESYNETAAKAGIPKVRVIGKLLKRQLQTRIKEDRSRRDLVWWRDYFRQVEESSHLCGRKEGDPNPWKADLLWLTTPSGMERTLAGRYVDREANPRTLSKAGRVNEATMRSMGVNLPAVPGKPELSPSILSDPEGDPDGIADARAAGIDPRELQRPGDLGRCVKCGGPIRPGLTPCPAYSGSCVPKLELAMGGEER